MFVFAMRQAELLGRLYHDLAVVTEGTGRSDASDDDPEIHMTQGERLRAELAAMALDEDDLHR